MSSNLIPDLNNIVGQFSDQKTYQNLIQINPQIYTEQKLIIQETEDIPIDDVLVFTNSYKIARSFEKDGNINYVAGTLAPFVEFYNLTELNDMNKYLLVVMNKNNNVYEPIVADDMETYIQQILYFGAYNPFNDFDNDLNLPAGMLYGLLSKDERLIWWNRIFGVKLTNPSQINNEELVSELHDSIYSALYYLWNLATDYKNQDQDTFFNTYPQEILNFVERINFHRPQSYQYNLVKIMNFDYEVQKLLPPDLLEEYNDASVNWMEFWTEQKDLILWNPASMYKDKIIQLVQDKLRNQYR